MDHGVQRNSHVGQAWAYNCWDTHQTLYNADICEVFSEFTMLRENATKSPC
jgi:hypothetical protein